ncbi:hypothetical protein TNCV_535261 [Trichonephila clavipes]|nr:hypothetical protein TNCV_535261 [Trichonephila clavipes]
MVLLACIYTSPGSSVAAVIIFIHKVLVLYTPEVASNVGSDDDKKLIFLTGDINVKFASEEAKPLIEFLKRTLNLTIITDARKGTTSRGTMTDAVFLTMQFSSHVFLIDYNRGFSYPTSDTTNLLFLSWKRIL